MTRDAIERLIPLLPQDSFILYGIPQAWLEQWDIAGKSRLNLQKQSWLLTDPEFAWKFSLSFAKKDKPLPSDMEFIEKECRLWMYHTNDFQRGFIDLDNWRHRAIRDARALCSKNQKHTKNFLDGMLLLQDQSYEAIGKRIGMSEEAVCIYAHLFWNVRDRWDEKTYISQIIYPDHRSVELSPSYLYNETERNLILRQAYNQGLDMLLREAGQPETLNELRAEDYARRCEGGMMASSMVALRLGGGHGLYPALLAGRQLIQSAKQGGQEQKGADAISGLESISAHYAVMEALNQLTKSSVDKMLSINSAVRAAESLPNVGEKGKTTTEAHSEKLQSPKMGSKPAPDWVETGYNATGE